MPIYPNERTLGLVSLHLNFEAGIGSGIIQVAEGSVALLGNPDWGIQYVQGLATSLVDVL